MEGSSRRAHATVYSRGTSSYRAPELIRGSQAEYTNKVDLWGVGCILYELVLRQKAFKNDIEIHEYAISGKSYDIVIGPETVPDDRRREFISKIIKELLSIDPTRRPRADILYERFISWGSDITAHQAEPSVVQSTTNAFDMTMVTSVPEVLTPHFARPNPLLYHTSLPSDVAHTDSSSTIIDYSSWPVDYSIPTIIAQRSDRNHLPSANATDNLPVTFSDTYPAPKSANHAQIEGYKRNGLHNVPAADAAAKLSSDEGMRRRTAPVKMGISANGRSLNKENDTELSIIDPKTLDFYQSLYDFVPNDPNVEMPLKKGDIVAILQKFEGGWWRGRKRDGDMGFVPAVYLDFIPRHREATENPRLAPPPLPKRA